MLRLAGRLLIRSASAMTPPSHTALARGYSGASPVNGEPRVAAASWPAGKLLWGVLAGCATIVCVQRAAVHANASEFVNITDEQEMEQRVEEEVEQVDDREQADEEEQIADESGEADEEALIVDLAKQLFDDADREYLETYETENFVPSMRHWNGVLRQQLAASGGGDDAELLWRLARTSHYLGRYSQEKKESEQLAREAHAFARTALERQPELWLAHKWVAVTLYTLCEIEGVRAMLDHAQLMKDHLDRAAQLNPAGGDAMVHHLRGYWAYYFANMPWIQRRIAATIFTEPPQASCAEALQLFLLAEQTEPDFYPRNKLMIGKSYLALGDHDNAVIWLRRAQETPIVNEDDKLCQQEATELLQSN